ncbi:MAG: DUF4093 domain-containing protein [Ruminococcaceae bacterium]|nr:DUF4093 domain-containing protein [Oscillospiraceae bacterium]
MISINEVIVVEGKYDKNTLSQIVDATILETSGFGIFKDKKSQEMLRSLARRRGIIILTDSDGAGFVIRNFISGIVEPQYIKHAYIPDIEGKERRKSTASKEGKLGVEGMTPEIIIEALRRSGATIDSDIYENRLEISKADLYAMGLFGKEGSAEKRMLLQKELSLPEHLSSNSLLKVLNIISSKKEIEEILSNYHK